MESLIRQLPSTSHYQAAIANDDEAAEAWLAHNKGKPETRTLPSWTEMNYTNQLLTNLGERIDQLIEVTSGEQQQLKPWPRPASAMARIKHRDRMNRHNSLVDEVKQAQKRWAEQHQ